MTLHDYNYGDDISDANFTSFHYDGTNLLEAYTITAGETYYVFGQIIGPKANVAILGYTNSFISGEFFAGDGKT